MALVFNNVQIDNAIFGTAVTAIRTVRAATVIAGTLATSFEAGDTIDGVLLVAGDRILIKNQASGVENGVYDVQPAGAPIRSEDFLANSGVASVNIRVNEGTVNANTGWVVTNDIGGDIVGTDALAFQQTTGTGVDGNVNGPVSSTDTAIVRWNGTTGTVIQNSNSLIGTNGDLTLNGTSAYIDLERITPPGAPVPTTHGRIYASNNTRTPYWQAGGATNILSLVSDNISPVNTATTGPGTLATDFEAGDIIDGVSLALGSCCLIKNQVNPIENGVYLIQATGAPVRVEDFGVGQNVAGRFMMVQSGTLNQGTGWIVRNSFSTAVVGTDQLFFDKFSGQIVNANGAESAGTTSATFVVYNAFLYPGRNLTGAVKQAEAITREDVGATTEVRIQDVTNGLTIASATTTSIATRHITFLTVNTANVPTSAAIFETQFRRATGAGAANVFTSGTSLQLG